MNFKKSLYCLSLVGLGIVCGVVVAANASNSNFLAPSAEACTHDHVEHYESQAATSSQNGHIEHWACCDCHTAFADETLTDAIGSTSDRTLLDLKLSDDLLNGATIAAPHAGGSFGGSFYTKKSVGDRLYQYYANNGETTDQYKGQKFIFAEPVDPGDNKYAQIHMYMVNPNNVQQTFIFGTASGTPEKQYPVSNLVCEFNQWTNIYVPIEKLLDGSGKLPFLSWYLGNASTDIEIYIDSIKLVEQQLFLDFNNNNFTSTEPSHRYDTNWYNYFVNASRTETPAFNLPDGRSGYVHATMHLNNDLKMGQFASRQINFVKPITVTSETNYMRIKLFFESSEKNNINMSFFSLAKIEAMKTSDPTGYKGFEKSSNFTYCRTLAPGKWNTIYVPVDLFASEGKLTSFVFSLFGCSTTSILFFDDITITETAGRVGDETQLVYQDAVFCPTVLSSTQGNISGWGKFSSTWAESNITGSVGTGVKFYNPSYTYLNQLVTLRDSINLTAGVKFIKFRIYASDTEEGAPTEKKLLFWEFEETEAGRNSGYTININGWTDLYVPISTITKTSVLNGFQFGFAAYKPTYVFINNFALVSSAE